jgi:glucokinase
MSTGSAHPWLVADIGGSNARFGWVAGPGSAIARIETLAVAQHAGPAEAAHRYLASLAGELGDAYSPPRHAALAVATAVAGDQVSLTNSPWSFSCAAVRDRLGLEQLIVLNDFEALALSLPHLRADQLRCHGALPQAAGTLAVIGPGTGLGVAGVVQTAGGWVALPGEGGHSTLAPADDFESEILRWVRGRHEHVSAERLLSGIGLPLLHEALAAIEGRPPPPPSSAEQIVGAGVADADRESRRTLLTFCALLGGFAGSVALTLGARGGVYIGGGIVPRMADLFFASAFRDRFEAKGRLAPYLAQVPTPLITDTLAALAGAAASIQGRLPALPAARAIEIA